MKTSGLHTSCVSLCLASLCPRAALKICSVSGSNSPRHVYKTRVYVCVCLKPCNSLPLKHTVCLIVSLCNLLGYEILPSDDREPVDEILPAPQPCGKTFLPQSFSFNIGTSTVLIRSLQIHNCAHFYSRWLFLFDALNLVLLSIPAIY